MTMIALTVNARAVKASVEPRTHLADFLRDGLDLTGTHLGCEHGVCGACTLLLDDMPARSCITYAVACDGARVTTIEGLDDDEITIELRAAFTREHALQCGYCTPGMLISARDLVLRLPVPDERQIRVGLSGNLCRCTGYVGIVRAVRAVIDQRRQRGILPVPGGGRTSFGPVGSGNGATASISNVAKATTAKAEPRADDGGAMAIPDFTPEKILEDHFTVAYPPERVFDMFGDVAKVAACLPGASLTGVPTPARVEGMIRVRLGPISANFRGAARIEDRIQLEGNAGANRPRGIGPRPRSPADRELCAQPRTATFGHPAGWTGGGSAYPEWCVLTDWPVAHACAPGPSAHVGPITTWAENDFGRKRLGPKTAAPLVRFLLRQHRKQSLVRRAS